MKVIRNKQLTHIPPVKMDVDNLDDLPYNVSKPLPPKSFAMLIVGQPGSGKSTLWNSLLLSHATKKNPLNPKFYYKYFDHIWLISPSSLTLPLDKLNLNENRIHTKYSDQLLEEILDTEQKDENMNNLIVLDDSVKDIKHASDILCRTILNRRHCTQNNSFEGQAGLSIMITAQKYKGGVPLYLRCNCSQIIVFRTENQSELNAIKDELMGDLTKVQQNKLLETCWDGKYDFLYIDAFKPKNERYYKNFDKIIIE